MSSLWLDVEVLADREDELQALAAELDEEDETEQDVPRRDDELPPIIQDAVPDVSTGEKQRDTPPVRSTDKVEGFAESMLRSLQRIADEEE